MAVARQLSIMTVFHPRENLFFLEEWLRYHLAIGCDHFYLYDNTGSRFIDSGNGLEVTGRNRRGQEVYRLLAHMDDAAIAEMLDRLLAPFEARQWVTRIQWRPRDSKGQITYGQRAAFFDYVRRFRPESRWTCFADIDEFMVPVRHAGMSGVLDELTRLRISYVSMPQRCFASRFDEMDRPVARVLDISRCSDWVSPIFGTKALIRNDTLYIPWFQRRFLIHRPPARGRRADRVFDPGLLRFNHYKFNAWELNWVSANLGHRLMLDREDRDLARWTPVISALAV